MSSAAIESGSEPAGIPGWLKVLIGVILLVVVGPPLLMAIASAVVVVVGVIGTLFVVISTRMYVADSRIDSVRNEVWSLSRHVAEREDATPCGSEAEARARLPIGAVRVMLSESDPVDQCLLDLGMSMSVYGTYWTEAGPNGMTVHGLEDLDGDGVPTHWTGTDAGVVEVGS